MSLLCFTSINCLHAPSRWNPNSKTWFTAFLWLGFAHLFPHLQSPNSNCEWCFTFPYLSILPLLLNTCFLESLGTPVLLSRSSHCVSFQEKPSPDTWRAHHSFPMNTFLRASHPVCRSAHQFVFLLKKELLDSNNQTLNHGRNSTSLGLSRIYYIHHYSKLRTYGQLINPAETMEARKYFNKCWMSERTVLSVRSWQGCWGWTKFSTTWGFIFFDSLPGLIKIL